MKITEIIEKKKQGKALTKEEIFFIVKGAMDGTIADYQLSAFFMAVYFQGMNLDGVHVVVFFAQIPFNLVGLLRDGGGESREEDRHHDADDGGRKGRGEDGGQDAVTTSFLAGNAYSSLRIILPSGHIYNLTFVFLQKFF